jgi:hypothetical protein
MRGYRCGPGKKYGPAPEEETPLTPVEPEVLDGGDGVVGLGVYGLASGCRVRRVDWAYLSRYDLTD